MVERDKGGERPEFGPDGVVIKPWGGFAVLREEKDYKVKVITVERGQRLSYQSHERREERWVVVRGTAGVTIDGQRSVLGEGEVATIGIGVKHRLDNPGASTLVVIEVQLGSYFGEDDITRFEDDYHRTGTKDP